MRRSQSRRLRQQDMDEIALHQYAPSTLRLNAERFSVILDLKDKLPTHHKGSISELVNHWMKQHYELALFATYLRDDDDKRAEIERRLAEREESMTALMERLDALEERRGAACRN